MLARKDVSAREVLGAHLNRIDQVDGRIRAFTEVLRDRAAADAAASDARRARGESLGPLDGVPVTVKECFDIAGRATTLGLPSWRRRTAGADATMVTALRRAGAVVLGRTNLSQTMLFVEARNPNFGQTANPWSLAHTPGVPPAARLRRSRPGCLRSASERTSAGASGRRPTSAASRG